MTYFIVKFRYKYRRNNAWSTWHTWHNKETYETIDEATAQLWQAYNYHKTNHEIKGLASKLEYEIEKIETTTISNTTIEL